eukprot:228268-Chlamydomonas_euryale.AAC.2
MRQQAASTAARQPWGRHGAAGRRPWRLGSGAVRFPAARRRLGRRTRHGAAGRAGAAPGS